MKNVDIFQIVSEIGSFIGTKDSKRQADQCPDMNSTVMSSEMMTDIVDLGMAVVTAGDAIISTRCHNLVKFNFSVGTAFFGEAGLQEPAATTTTIIIGLIWGHLDDIFLAHH